MLTHRPAFAADDDAACLQEVYKLWSQVDHDRLKRIVRVFQMPRTVAERPQVLHGASVRTCDRIYRYSTCTPTLRASTQDMETRFFNDECQLD